MADTEKIKEKTTKFAEKPQKKDVSSSSATPELKVGMTVRVHQRIKDANTKGEEKERVQVFEGIIIARHKKRGAGATVTVRKISNGVGVEKIFPIDLPTIVKWEPVKQARVRRAKLYYLKGFTKRLKEIRV